jgi:hypothetical protein
MARQKLHKTTDESYLQLSILDFDKSIFCHESTDGVYSYKTGDGNTVLIHTFVFSDGVLSFKISQADTNEVTDHSIDIGVTYPYKGERKWLLCNECGERFDILYMAERDSDILCRKCAGLTYFSSQRQNSLLYTGLIRPRNIMLRSLKSMTNRRKITMSEIQSAIKQFTTAMNSSVSCINDMNKKSEAQMGQLLEQSNTK